MDHICDDHKRLAADVDRHQRWIGDLQTETRAATASLQADLRTHCNGDHLKRRELDDLRANYTKDVTTMTELQAKLMERLEDGEKCLRDHEASHKVETAAGTRSTTLTQIIVTGITAVAVGALSVLGNYLLIATKLGQ